MKDTAEEEKYHTARAMGIEIEFANTGRTGTVIKREECQLTDWRSCSRSSNDRIQDSYQVHTAYNPQHNYGSLASCLTVSYILGRP